MKKNTNKILKVGILFSLIIGVASFVSIVKADTWAAPTSAPPGGNSSSPLNTSSSSQFKLGTLGIGESSSTSTSSSTPLEVNGILSTNGVANFGPALFYQNTHIGPYNTCTSCYTTTQLPPMNFNVAYPALGGLPAYIAPTPGTTYSVMSGSSLDLAPARFRLGAYNYNETKGFAQNNNESIFATVAGRIGGFINNIFNPESTYAAAIGAGGSDTGPNNPNPLGPCYGQWCNSSQWCDDASKSCLSMGTTITGTSTLAGQFDNNTAVVNTGFTSAGDGGDGTDPGTTGGLPVGQTITVASQPGLVGFSQAIFPGTKRGKLIAELSLSTIPSTGTATPLHYATTTTGTLTLHWHIASASNCQITSSNPDRNWNANISLNPAGFSNGFHDVVFGGSPAASPGSYTYVLTCSQGAEYFTPHGASDSVTVTVGDQYVMQVNGNTSLEGYVVANGNVVTNGLFIEQGKRVCLEDGTDCPPNNATNVINPIAMGGSVELGGNDLVNNNNQTPYINFHYGGSTNKTDPYNFRIINGTNQTLDFQNYDGWEIMTVKHDGLYMQSSQKFYAGSELHHATDAIPIYHCDLDPAGSITTNTSCVHYSVVDGTEYGTRTTVGYLEYPY